MTRTYRITTAPDRDARLARASVRIKDEARVAYLAYREARAIYELEAREALARADARESLRHAMRHATTRAYAPDYYRIDRSRDEWSTR